MSFVIVVCVPPVAVSVSVTVAPTITAFVGSVICPETVPVAVDWARIVPDPNNMSRRIVMSCAIATTRPVGRFREMLRD